MLGMIQILCGFLYLIVLVGILLGGVLAGKRSGKEKRICICEPSSVEKEIFRARRRLSVNERLVLCLPIEQIFNSELHYIVMHMQQKDPALQVLWMKEKGARAG